MLKSPNQINYLPKSFTGKILPNMAWQNKDLQ